MPIQGTHNRKSRPVVVVSSQPFTNRTGFVHLLPIATTLGSRLESLVPRLVAGRGKLDPKSRLILDILITENANVLGEKIGDLEEAQLRQAIAAFSATLAST